MKFTLSLLLLFTPGILSAQNAANETRDSAGTVYKVPLQLQKTPSADSCPVSLRARRQGAVILKNARDGSLDRTPSQILEVFFFNSQDRNVVSVVLRVHGYDGSAHVMPGNAIRKNQRDLSKTIDLNISVLARNSSSTNLTMRQFGAVSRIDVESIDFADGTSWKAAEQGQCSFTPDLFMLVSRDR